MVLLNTANVEFRAVLARHIRELERTQPERHGVGWFFLRYLRRVAKFAEECPSARATEPAMRGLVRFYSDQVDPQSELATRFDEVLAAQRHALRSESSGDPQR